MNLDDLPYDILPRVSPAAASAAPDPGVLLELQALALRHGRAEAAATAVASELALRLGGHRVSLVWRDAARPGRPGQLAAMSHGADPDVRRESVRHILKAADEALDIGRPVQWPAPDTAPAPAALAHAELLKAGGSTCVFSVPFDVESDLPGVFVFELPQAPDERIRTQAQDAALFIGPVLMLKWRLAAPWRIRWRSLFAGEPGLRDADWLSPARMAMLAAGIGVVAAALWPTTHHIVAQTRVEGLGQRSITAPVDGFLLTADVRPGENVRAGQVLATLDDREPQLEVERAGAERAQVERQYRDALARDDAGQIIASRARLEQLQAQHELALRRLERLRLVAPFDGVLIGGDLASAIGTPVQRGQELMVVAPTTGWRVVAEVDEQDILRVQAGQKAQVLFAALAGRSAEVTVTRIAPVAVQAEGRNVFEAEGRLNQPVDGLRPGLRGVARIEAGQRAPAAVWWERGSNWLRRMWWTFIS
jgi:multidrug efflux pump subunit AcrA (membrane-fusion protein)